MNENIIDISLEFTKVYKENKDKHKAIREMKCYSVLFPAVLTDLKEDDDFAGHLGHAMGLFVPPIDIHPTKYSEIGYTMCPDTFTKLKEEFPERKDDIDGIMEYWKKESTFVKIRETAPKEIKDYLFDNCRAKLDKYGYRREKENMPRGAGFITGSYDTRCAGITPDFEKLVKKGICGLLEEVNKAEEKNKEAKDFYTALKMGLEISINCLEHYRIQAEKIYEETTSDEVKIRMGRIKDALENLKTRKPETFFEAVQLVMIFMILCRVENHGRLDVVFGDFLAKDLEKGIITEEEAINLTISLWKFIGANGHAFDTRVMIGGKGRKNEKNADKFALIAIEATRRLHAIMPVLTLRWSKEQNPLLLEKGLKAIGEGCIYPTLYNDDAYLEGIMSLMNVPFQDAVNYEPLGCGEILLATCSAGSPNSTFKFLKAFEVTLHNGKDGSDGKEIGIKTGEVEEFDTYEKLENAFIEQVRASYEKDVLVHKWNREAAAKEVDLVILSLLSDNCIERGKGILDGGLKYFGANSEGFGMTNTANSLAVIKKLVYEEKKYTLREIVNILDNNYEGFEEQLREFKSIPKYGNNDDYVDEIKVRIENKIHKLCNEIGVKNGFSWYTVANVNPGGINGGPQLSASADGRKCGEPMALANSPHPGTDKEGLLAMLSSVAKTSPENGGCVTNMNLSRETITSHFEKFKMAVETYFMMGGLQLNINCFSKGDLEKALKNPENYPNLIVRVSGYSAKFTDLNEVTQKHIMERTLY